MFVRIWQYHVRPEAAPEFRVHYGPGGAWDGLFRRVAGFLGTELLQSTSDSDTYFTLDLWESPEAWAAFLRAWGEDYTALDHRCESLTASEIEVGEFRRS